MQLKVDASLYLAQSNDMRHSANTRWIYLPDS